MTAEMRELLLLAGPDPAKFVRIRRFLFAADRVSNDSVFMIFNTMNSRMRIIYETVYQ